MIQIKRQIIRNTESNVNCTKVLCFWSGIIDDFRLKSFSWRHILENLSFRKEVSNVGETSRRLVVLPSAPTTTQPVVLLRIAHYQ
jgi:hypothetical protein